MNRAKPRVTTVLLARPTRALKRHFKGALEGDVAAVHQTRVASRRLREAVPILATGTKGSRAGRARRKLRRLTRTLGTVRELDVTLALLDELAARNELPRLALEEVRARVVRERDRRRELMVKRLQRLDADKLYRRLASVGQAVAQSDSMEWRDRLAPRLMGRAKVLADAISTAGRVYAPEQLHGVRIAAKKLRYTMELAGESGIKPAAALVRTLKQAQDILGRLHDLQVLQSHIRAVQAEATQHAPTNHALDTIALALEDECRHLHASYLSATPALQALAADTRTVVVPQLAARRSDRARRVKMGLTSRRPFPRRAVGAPRRA
ncbi:MAG TPA: CHAD domain-containing protein [Vicinamibacterales bacterium]|nr:CHAD domain-containing protein [Vicinamibacterales bacterium]